MIFIALGIKPIRLSDDVNLYIHQDDYYVWLGYNYPANSYGTLDLKVVTDKIVDTLNLHVSAQLGEWMLKDTTQIPKTSNSNLWWETEGWTSKVVWMNGVDTSVGST